LRRCGSRFKLQKIRKERGEPPRRNLILFGAARLGRVRATTSDRGGAERVSVWKTRVKRKECLWLTAGEEAPNKRNNTRKQRKISGFQRLGRGKGHPRELGSNSLDRGITNGRIGKGGNGGVLSIKRWGRGGGGLLFIISRREV